MKLLYKFLAAGLLMGGSWAGAQDLRVILPETETGLDHLMPFSEQLSSKRISWALFAPEPRYTGILMQARQAANPLQLVNPFAPARYGDGRKNVTRDPVSGRVDGLSIFSIKW